MRNDYTTSTLDGARGFAECCAEPEWQDVTRKELEYDEMDEDV